ncbi:MAG: glycoside hydrolase family 3 C-terminal domain-containing protein [Rubrivivax sp.]|nr:glycoside hydrolase family 3 C-terminal domain-containing protein [Rubrivivax sp.]
MSPASKFISRRQFLKKGLTAGASLLLPGCGQNASSPTPNEGQAAPSPGSPAGSPIYLDPTYPIEERVNDLVGRMSLDEKISQMGSDAPAIERLGLPQYNWWNEALHGVGRAGLATVFPQAIGLASTWNPDLIFRVAEVISDEGRAKHHEAARQGIHDLYTGLTFWSPNINIFRDPRWGRGQETYGEDPFLTSRLAIRFVQGLQGDDPLYLKTVATPKHFAVHSGPENERHSFNALVSPRDLHMTYLPAFKACIMEGQAFSIMGAYNRVNDEACCASPTLLQEILREAWGFEGYVVSDCGAIHDIYANHRLVKTAPEAAALAVRNGCDLECGCTYGIPCHYGQLAEAIRQGLVTEAEIDRSVKRLFMARFKLGLFDPSEAVPYSQIPYSVVDSPEHRALALEAAQQPLVLLKNQDNLLPLDGEIIKTIAVIGPNAAETLVLMGNYMGTPAEPISVLAGIQIVVSPETQVIYARGCEIDGSSEAGFAEAIEAAQKAQVAVMVMGLSQQLEGEEGQQEGNPPGVVSLGDRVILNLPPIQEKLLQAVYQTGTPTILVLLNGSAVAVNWADEHIPAILEAWYPGQAGGAAIANALFGLFNPGGRLPITFYRSSSDLPPFADYRMANRTYRYFMGDPLYPFGFGLSYTTFAYRNLQITPVQVEPGGSVSIQVEVENTGQRLGDEVVQLYLKDMVASLPVPQLQLQGFSRIRLAPGEKQIVHFTLTAEQISFVDDNGQWVLEPGEFKVWLGGQQPDRKTDSPPANGVSGRFTVQV